MKKYYQKDRPENAKKIYPIAITKGQANRGYTERNCKMYYEVNEWDRTILLCCETIYDYQPEIVKWNQYATHYGGEFTVSDEQQRKFDNALRRVKKISKKFEKKS